MGALIRPVEAVADTPPYCPARPRAPMRWYLDGNEGAPPAPGLLGRLDEEAARRLCRYPDASALTATLAARLGLDPAQILVTAGADDAMDRFCRAFLGPGRELVLPIPTFEMLRRYAALSGGAVVTLGWPGGPLPVAEIKARVTPRTAALAIITPNNPTGAVATTAEVLALARDLPGVMILLDLAYVEYADEDPTAAVTLLPNVVVLRTLSKAWGLAGLRVGYAVAAPQVIEWMRAAGAPYAVSQPSLDLAQAWLAEGAERVARGVAIVREERQRLRDLLEALGCRAQPSQGNFVWAEVPEPEFTQAALRAVGIATRRFPERPELAGALRISCPGDPEGMGALEAGLRLALTPQALLLDMDGVLADVSRSYRQAIIATAEGYGVTLTPDEIAAAKAEGGANDDWSLTQRLLAARGVVRPLEEVTARFEALYQGDDERAGLKETERLTVDRAWLEALAARWPLAIVTGRPQRDAEWLLERQGVADLFSAVVARESGPLKPDPAPVEAALERLGVERAWMIGDTPDDIVAARGAGALPIGVVAPGADPLREVDALTRAGAAVVLARLDALSGVLP